MKYIKEPSIITYPQGFTYSHFRGDWLFALKKNQRKQPMTSKLKCPFCKEEIISDVCCVFNKKNKDYTNGRQIYKCNKCSSFGNKELWQALIQAKQDLEIATSALYEICNDYQEDSSERAEKALKQITHDNSEKPNSQS